MRKSRTEITKILAPVSFLLVLLALVACSSDAIMPTPEVTPRPGPNWTAQQAIEKIEELPLATGEPSWNAEFDRFSGRWQLTLVYDVRKLYPPRDERRTLRWYVYEDTGEVAGPLK
jgi:hypothetical protein